MVEPIFDYQFRIIVVGDSTVGKSALLRAFTEGKFSEICDPTVGVDFFARLIEVRDGIRVKLQLWDTAGQERFRTITWSYYRNSVGALLLYDITRRSSFDHLIEWLFEARRHIEPGRAVFEVVACKVDLEGSRVVSTEEGKAFAESHGLSFIETSAKTGYNLENTFTNISQQIYDKIQSGELKMQDGWDGIRTGFSRSENTVRLMEAEVERDGCC
ncbi:ras-related protein Rab-39B [Trichonephila inaurata madagascariensis]|uniref:Ras-related protein Rab-39B n=1 Tax=Trichonephila inaurata madagascariensis TaxID=2747483 RepID=A0A8X6MCU7_9ARAC|nr:ras-related protein Rab-39B [Trichonephila inaurata madagascariensis]